MNNKFIFIIDTDCYAGNFEREMCAYVTGELGDCGVGDNFADLYNKEVTNGPNFEEYIENRADDNGHRRPCQCWPTEGFLSMGDKTVRKADWNQTEADTVHQETLVGIYRGYLKQVEAVDLSDPAYIRGNWTQKSKDESIAQHKKQIEKASREKSPKHKPNNSVAIFFERKPTTEMITLMKERVSKFSEVKRQIAKDEGLTWDLNFNLTIYGFRLICETTMKRSQLV